MPVNQDRVVKRPAIALLTVCIVGVAMSRAAGACLCGFVLPGSVGVRTRVVSCLLAGRSPRSWQECGVDVVVVGKGDSYLSYQERIVELPRELGWIGVRIWAGEGGFMVGYEFEPNLPWVCPRVWFEFTSSWRQVCVKFGSNFLSWNTLMLYQTMWPYRLLIHTQMLHVKSYADDCLFKFIIHSIVI